MITATSTVIIVSQGPTNARPKWVWHTSERLKSVWSEQILVWMVWSELTRVAHLIILGIVWLNHWHEQDFLRHLETEHTRNPLFVCRVR